MQYLLMAYVSEGGWDKLTEAGGMVVDKMVNIELKLEFVQQ